MKLLWQIPVCLVIILGMLYGTYLYAHWEYALIGIAVFMASGVIAGLTWWLWLILFDRHPPIQNEREE